MLTRKKIKKVAFASLTSLAVIAGIPLSMSHAAPQDDLQRIFSKVGWKYSEGKLVTQPNYSEDSANETPSNVAPSIPEKNPPQNKIENPSDLDNSSEQSNALADRVIKTGEKYLGVPYRLGAPSGQTKLFDCSLFTQQVFKENKISLPRSSRQQATVGKTVSRSEIKKGDLLFFKTSSSNGKIGHVGIYAGNNKVLHTWGPGGVRYDSMDTRWLKEGFITAKRVINN
jgi:cell wall-associated NlpC family hydrolase